MTVHSLIVSKLLKKKSRTARNGDRIIDTNTMCIDTPSHYGLAKVIIITFRISFPTRHNVSGRHCARATLTTAINLSEIEKTAIKGSVR